MCGIVFVAGNIMPVHRKVFSQLLTVDQLRGEDSTGIAAVSKWMQMVDVVKEIGTPDFLLYSKRGASAVDKENCVLIGHNRYATVGGVSRETAHPFENHKLVGVHNGTLGSKYRLHDHVKYAVDSEALYAHIADFGLQAAINLLDSPRDAWSLVFWDKREKTFNLLRNSDRPMYTCWSDDGKTLFGASEGWMLYAILGRNDIKHTDITETVTDQLYKFLIDRDGNISEPEVTEVKAPPPLPFPTATTTAHGKIRKSKASLVVVNNEYMDLPRSYANQELVTLEILDKGVDKKNVRYISLFDKDNPKYPIRLYHSQKDQALEAFIGYEVITSILCLHHEANGQSYYRANPINVKLVFDDAYEDTFKDANGILLKKADWEKKYQQCDYCSTNLIAGEGVKFTTSGECFCKHCADNQEVKDMVNFI